MLVKPYVHTYTMPGMEVFSIFLLLNTQIQSGNHVDNNYVLLIT